jgi:hypothetical protein
MKNEFGADDAEKRGIDCEVDGEMATVLTARGKEQTSEGGIRMHDQLVL